MISQRTRLNLMSMTASLLMATCSHAQSPQSEQTFKEASQYAIDAGVAIFQCLSEGKQNKSEAVLIDRALTLLGKAGRQYEKLQRERGDKAFNPQGADLELTLKLIGEFSQDPQVKLSNQLKKEGHVAELNKLSIDLLAGIVKEWHGSCTTPFREKRKYIEFIGAKVRVEKASQLGEIAFSTSMK